MGKNTQGQKKQREGTVLEKYHSTGLCSLKAKGNKLPLNSGR